MGASASNLDLNAALLGRANSQPAPTVARVEETWKNVLAVEDERCLVAPPTHPVASLLLGWSRGLLEA